MRPEGVFGLLLFTFAAAALAVAAGPAVELDVPRGISFDRHISASQDANYGTRRLLLRGALSLFSAASADKAAAYKGTTVFIPCGEHLTKSIVTELSSAPINGMLVALCERDSRNEELLALFFASTTVNYPVYFVEENSLNTTNDASAVERLLRQHNSGSEYVVVAVGKSLRATQPFVNETVPFYQIHSNLIVKPKGSGQTDIPRVLVTANFDTFGVAPASHTTGGASGAAAAIELYRRQSASAAATSLSGKGYGLSVLLSSSARFNYAGTAAWLQARKDSEMDRVKLIISLDELLPPGGSVSPSAGEAAVADEAVLYMHLPDSLMRGGIGKSLSKAAQSVASAHGIELKVQTSKTDYQHYDLRFEHEVFANRQLPAVTFSTHRTPPADQILRGSVRHSLDEKAVAELAKRVAFVQAYVEMVLELNDGMDAAAANRWTGTVSYLAGLLRGAARTVRCPLAFQGRPLSRYAESVEQLLRQVDVATRAAASGVTASVVASTTLQKGSVKPTGLVVYGPFEESMKLFVAKTATAEGSIAACVLAALVLFGLSEFGLGGLKKVVLGY